MTTRLFIFSLSGAYSFSVNPNVINILQRMCYTVKKFFMKSMNIPQIAIISYLDTNFHQICIFIYPKDIVLVQKTYKTLVSSDNLYVICT